MPVSCDTLLSIRCTRPFFNGCMREFLASLAGRRLLAYAQGADLSAEKPEKAGGKRRMERPETQLSGMTQGWAA